jgi:hypothetical protein
MNVDQAVTWTVCRVRLDQIGINLEIVYECSREVIPCTYEVYSFGGDKNRPLGL